MEISGFRQPLFFISLFETVNLHLFILGEVDSWHFLIQDKQILWILLAEKKLILQKWKTTWLPTMRLISAKQQDFKCTVCLAGRF